MLDSFFMNWGNRDLVFSCCYLLVSRTPRCQWLLWPHTPCCLWPQIPSLFLALKEYYPLAFSSWCSAPVVTCRIHYVSSTWWKALVCKLAFLLHRGLGIVQKTCFKLLVLHYFDVFAIQPDFLAQSVSTTLYFFIVDSFLLLLCME